MLFAKKRKRPEKIPVWFKWMIGGFLLYAITVNLFTDPVSDARRQTEEAKTQGPVDFSNVKGRIARSPAQALHAFDRQIGAGEPAGCWQEVALRYRLYSDKGTLIEEIAGDAEPRRFRLGGQSMPLGLERGLLGMRVGGERVITMHPKLARVDGKPPAGLEEDAYAGYIVALEAVEAPEGLKNIAGGTKIYDDTLGEGRPAQCTDTVLARVRAVDGSGQEVFARQGLVRIGEGMIPHAAEYALIGMRPNGQRTVIVQPGHMQPVSPDAPPAQSGTGQKDMAASADGYVRGWQDLPPAPDQIIVLEVTLLPRYN